MSKSIFGESASSILCTIVQSNIYKFNDSLADFHKISEIFFIKNILLMNMYIILYVKKNFWNRQQIFLAYKLNVFACNNIATQFSTLYTLAFLYNLYILHTS